MPFTQIIPPSFPDWEWDTGPGMLQTTLTNRGANMPSPLQPSYMKGSFPDAPSTTFSLQVAVSSIPVLDVHRGIPCWRLQPLLVANGSGFWFGDNQMVNPSTAQFNSSVSVLGPNRVFIDEFLIAFATPATLNTSARLPAYTPTTGVGAPALAPGIISSQYGIHPDGVGGFNWYSYVGAVQTDAVAITWPEADLSNWVRIRVEHFNAQSPTIPAFVRFWVNNVNVVTRSWGAGTVLPDYTGDNHFRRQVNSWANTSTAIYVAQFRSRIGSFDASGVLIT